MPKQLANITLQPAVLKWARMRINAEYEELAGKLKVSSEAVEEWERSGRITMNQAQDLAKHTLTPLGYLYLPAPPDDSLPIADFRTRTGDLPQKPSPNLLETVYQMQRRQAWMREEMIAQDDPPLDFVAAYGTDFSPQTVAVAMAETLGISEGWVSVVTSWTNALRTLRDIIESAGVLVVFNGVVGNNSHRKLDPEEFQGFALVDEYAPLIFVNNSDFKTAQIFTLAHELAHVFVGETGLSSLSRLESTEHDTEVMCNQIAAEFLVPEDQIHSWWETARRTPDPFQELARHFRVSTVVAARRALDTDLITRDSFFQYYEDNKAKTWAGNQPGEARGGGNFWYNQRWRIGERFGAAVSRAVLAGRLTYTEAYRLTNLRGDTFAKMPEEMGFSL